MKSLIAAFLAGNAFASLAIDGLPTPTALEQARGHAEVEGPDTKALGVFRDSESPSAAFSVRNAGDETLKITGVMKTCGCAGATADRSTLAPGATTTVRVTVEPYTLDGAFSKSVFVLTDAAGAQPLRLTVTGECVPLFSVKPSKTVDTGKLPNGAPWQGAFEIEASAVAVLGAAAVTSDCPAEVSAEASAGAAADRPRWTVPVRLTPPTNGGFRCRIFIPVLSPTNRPPLTLEVAGRAGAELFAVPSIAAIPLSAAPVTRTVRLRLSGPRGRKLDPAQLRITPSLENLDVRAEPESDGGLKASLTVSPALARRLAESGPVRVTLSVPDAAPTAITLQPTTTEKDRRTDQR